MMINHLTSNYMVMSLQGLNVCGMQLLWKIAFYNSQGVLIPLFSDGDKNGPLVTTATFQPFTHHTPQSAKYKVQSLLQYFAQYRTPAKQGADQGPRGQSTCQLMHFLFSEYLNDSLTDALLWQFVSNTV